MGSFGGHALPGSFFYIFGLWYAVQTFRRYFWSRETNTPFVATAAFPCSCLCGRVRTLPVEAFIKVFFGSVGVIVEISNGFRPDGSFAIGNGQHATMFTAFGLTGVADILVHYRLPVPKHTDYASLILAFAVEGILFKFHLYGRSPLDVLVHTLLIYTVAMAVIGVLVEMRYRHNVWGPLMRAFFFLVQGTWFWQVGFILYDPATGGNSWDEYDHEQLMMATLYFVWHAGFNFVFLLILGAVIHCWCFRRKGGHVDRNQKELQERSQSLQSSEDKITYKDELDSDPEVKTPGD